MKWIKLFENFSNIEKDIEYDFNKGGIAYSKFKNIGYIKYLTNKYNREFDLNEFYQCTIFDGTYITPKFMWIEHKDWVEYYILMCEEGSSILEKFNSDINTFKNKFTDSLPMCRDMYSIKEKYSKYIVDNFLETYINQNSRIKFKNFLKNEGIIPIEPKKEILSKFEKDVINNIKLGADDNDDITKLKDIILNIEKQFQIQVNKKYVSLFRLGNMPDDKTGALYFPKSKLIKLNKSPIYSHDVTDYYDDFIHEYAHAVDMAEALRSMFFPLYKNMLDSLYEKTKEEFFILNREESFFTKVDIPYKFIYGGKYDNDLKELGYPRTYCISKLSEFVACCLEHYFMRKYMKEEWYYHWDLNTELYALCEDIHNKFFK